MTFSFTHGSSRSFSDHLLDLDAWSLIFFLLFLNSSSAGFTLGDMSAAGAGLWNHSICFCVLKRESDRKCCVGSMAPPVQRRRDSCTRWPRMSSTFWAVLLLTALLLLYCGKSRTVTAPRATKTPQLIKPLRLLMFAVVCCRIVHFL